MEKKELINVIDTVLSPYGFNQKGNHWVINLDEIVKIINLQKSSFGDAYYINYGFIIKVIPLNGWKSHVFGALGSKSKRILKRISALLNLDSHISDEERAFELKLLLRSNLLDKIQNINSEEDILGDLKHRKNLNMLPPLVKDYFNLSRQE